MIVFRTIRWKNFLSTGNNFTEIDLLRNNKTLIVGKNGCGKSTLLDALCFSLFNKPHRNIKKDQIINSINNKDCIVEVEFSINGKEFKIIRGIKPKIFEIYQDGVMLNQNADSRDYQKHLEVNILKINYKSFNQIVVLGSSSFTPFMQLSIGDRRHIIEDILDISILTTMRNISKSKISTTKSNILELKKSIEHSGIQINTQQRLIDNMKKINNNNIEEKQDQIKSNNNKINELTKSSIETMKNINSSVTEKINKIIESKSLCSANIASANSMINDYNKSNTFLSNNDTCPTCNQSITEEFCNNKIHITNNEIEKIQKTLNETQLELDGFIKEEKVLQVIVDKNNEINQQLVSNKNLIDNLNKQNDELLKVINEQKEDSSDDLYEQQSLDEMKNEKSDYIDQKVTREKELEIQNICFEILKDTGIKTKIIKEYLPAINKYINEYLNILDFFVKFEFDENFDESIKSRHRDLFKYANFSEGEKSRIDLALLFTWRQVAKIKNSTNTNLLVLDETFDSSLDDDGVDNLIKILDTLDKNINIYVISHKGDILDDKFESKIEFIKPKNFSEMK